MLPRNGCGSFRAGATIKGLRLCFHTYRTPTETPGHAPIVRRSSRLGRQRRQQLVYTICLTRRTNDLRRQGEMAPGFHAIGKSDSNILIDIVTANFR